MRACVCMYMYVYVCVCVRVILLHTLEYINMNVLKLLTFEHIFMIYNKNGHI